MTIALKILSFIALAYGALIVFTYFFAERLIFPTPKSTYSSLKNLEMLTLEDGRKIASIFLKNPQSNICILYSHGNGEDLAKIYPLLKTYNMRLNVNIIAYDYCGYGISEGKMTQKDLPKCADAVFNHTVSKLGFKPENIFFAGYSLGSVPSAYLGAKHPNARGVIIIGGVSRAVKTILPFDIIPWKILHNVENIERIEIPILFLHGCRDKTVNIRNAYENLSAVKHSNAHLVKFAEYGHFPLFESEVYWNEISNFIKDNK